MSDPPTTPDPEHGPDPRLEALRREAATLLLMLEVRELSVLIGAIRRVLLNRPVPEGTTPVPEDG